MLRNAPHSLSVLLFGTCYFLPTMSTGWIYIHPICNNAVHSCGYVLLFFLLKSAGFLKKLSLTHSLQDSICQHSTSEAHYFQNYIIVRRSFCLKCCSCMRTCPSSFLFFGHLKFFLVKTIHVVLCGLLFLAQNKNCVSMMDGQR